MSTLATNIARPAQDEYDLYYERYISLVATDDIVATLQKQAQETQDLLSPLSEQQANFCYAPGKWSVKEILGHISDTERILSYRALRISRGDKTPIEGFDQDDYVPNAKFDRRTMGDLLAEFSVVRNATVHLFRHWDAEAGKRVGTANQKQITARALAYIIAGHELHHRRILREKYLK